MIHTIYSNSYEVLRAVLLNNIDALRLRPEAESLRADECFAGVFDRVPVIIPSKAVETDLVRAIAKQESVCASMRFMFLSEWLGFFSREPLANVIGNEARWMIWRELRATGPGSLREAVRTRTTRLEDSLKNRSDHDLLLLAQRIAGVFVAYSSYRLDWILAWLGLHQDRLHPTPQAKREAAALAEDEDAVWQRELFRRLARSKRWRGRGFLEHLPESLQALADAPANARTLVLGDGREVALPNALHVFVPFVVPPLMLPVLKAYAHSGREVWLYLLNPSSEYWFDLVPRRLYDWKHRDETAGQAEVGHPILADNGRSTRANIDRLWRFTQERGDLTEFDEDDDDARKRRQLPVETHSRKLLDERDFLRQYLSDPKDLRADLTLDTQSIYIEANEPTLLRRVQDSILNLSPDLLSLTARQQAADADAPELFDKADDSLRFVGAPSAARELEGLVDWLQAQFQADPTLTPSDVLVVTPDISAAAPLIDQVFGSLAPERRIAYRVCGAVSADSDVPLAVLIGLKNLLIGGFTRERFVEWLSLPIVSEKFDLESDDLAILNRWLAAAGFEVGLNPAHLDAQRDAQAADPRQTQVYAPAALHELTLERALERLAFGWMLPQDEDAAPYGDVLPVVGTELGGWDATGEKSGLLLKLANLYAVLETLRLKTAEGEKLTDGTSAHFWTLWIGEVLQKCFPAETPQRDWLAIRRAAADLADEIAQARDEAERIPDVSFEIFIAALEERLKRGETGAGRPGNTVVFSGMRQLRGLPYKVIVLWGLNEDSSFPGASHAEEFDLMKRFPRRSDRDSRTDNRNIFLDLLLAARSKFLISYTEGANPAQWKEPSVVAQELREWLLTFAQDPADRLRASAILTHHLPLNAFSPKSFSAEEKQWQSTNRKMLEAVDKAAAANWNGPAAPWANALTARAEGGRLPVKELYRWMRNPAEAFLKRHGIRLSTGEEIDPAPILQRDKDLPKWQRIHTLLNVMLSAGAEGADQAVETLGARWAVDPRMGAQGLRDWRYSDDVVCARTAASLYWKLTSQMTALAPQEAAAAVPGFPWTLTHAASNLWRDASGAVHWINVVPGKITGSGAIQSLFIWALLRAAGAAAEGQIIVTDVEKKGSPLIDAPQWTPQEAQTFLGYFLKLYEAFQLGRLPFAVPPYQPKSRGAEAGQMPAERALPNAIVWRGLDQAQAEAYAEHLEKALEGLYKVGDLSALESVVQGMLTNAGSL